MFIDEQYIAAEGEIGDKFYITVLGNVRNHALVRRMFSIMLVDDIRYDTPRRKYVTESDVEGTFSVFGRSTGRFRYPQ